MTWRASGEIADPFEQDRRYRVIYADPPWIYRDRAVAGRRGAGFKYPLLDDAGVAALPVERIAADDAMLFLWVTWPKLAEVLPVIDAWGFRFRTVGFVWIKRTRLSGALAWGMGSWTRANTEPCLLATRGRPSRVSAAVHQVVEAPLARHSEKPAEVRERIVRLAGDVPRIELFARQVPPGWDAWGNDVGGSRVAAPAGLPRRGTRDWLELRERIVAQVRASSAISRNGLCESLEVAPDAMRVMLTALVRDGVLEKRGRTRGTRYTLVDESGSAPEETASPAQAQIGLGTRDD